MFLVLLCGSEISAFGISWNLFTGAIVSPHNACHHPPETSHGEAETLVLGRVNDVVGRQDLRPVWHLLLVQVMQVH